MERSAMPKKNGKSKKNKTNQCIALGSGKFFFYPYMKKKSNTGAGFSKMIRGLAATLKSDKPESIERAIEIIMEKGSKAIKTLKKLPRKITIPKKIDIKELLISIFTAFSVRGVLHCGAENIVTAVNITADAKMNLDRGEQWAGDIKISDNLVLKLTNSGLVLNFE